MKGKTITKVDTMDNDILMSVNYYKLKKLKKMFDQNQADMEVASFDNQLLLLRIHIELKEVEREITKKLGTVILK